MSRFVAWTVGRDGWGVYEVEPALPPSQWSPTEAETELVAAFGFVDPHIHGGYGVDFMDADLAANRRLFGELRRLGYEGLLPTTVAATAEAVLRAVDALPDDPMNLGFHLEGPFLSPRFPGAQPPDHIVEIAQSDPLWNEVLDHPLLRVVTLAPELPGALEWIARLAERGVRVSLGHTDATLTGARLAERAGARQATHTFNAMRPFHHREPGILGWLLGDSNLDAELIADGVHVDADAARLLAKCVGPERLIAVSDASSAMGMAPGTPTTLWGQPCIVGTDSVRLARNGALAGSTRALDFALLWLGDQIGPEAAVRATSVNARRALRIDTEPRVVLKWDLRLRSVQPLD